MVKTCCVDGCTSNYRPSKAKNACLKAKYERKNGDRKPVSVFGFPSKMKSAEERLRWIKTIPYWSVERDDGTKENPVVCIKHWPDNFTTKLGINGKNRPVNPPSIFQGIPSSHIPMPPPPPPPPRPTERCTAEVRNRREDEMNEFAEKDKVSFEKMVESLCTGDYEFDDIPIVTFLSCGEQWIQSMNLVSGIPGFSLKIQKNQSYVAYCVGVECRVETLWKNRIRKLDAWSRIAEAIRFLKNRELTQHEKVIQEQIECMRPQRVSPVPG